MLSATRDPAVIDLTDAPEAYPVQPEPLSAEQVVHPFDAEATQSRREDQGAGGVPGAVAPEEGEGAAPTAREAVHIGVSSSMRGVDELAGGRMAPAGEEEPWENKVCEIADRDGETLVTAGPMPAEDMDETLARLEQIASVVECDATLVHVQEQPSKDGGAPLRTTYSLRASAPERGTTSTCAWRWWAMSMRASRRSSA